MSELHSSVLVEGVVDAQGVEDVVKVVPHAQYAQVAQVSCVVLGLSVGFVLRRCHVFLFLPGFSSR